MTRLVDDVYGHLRDEILEGKMPPGFHLAVPSIAERLNVSRSPVREAVQRLTLDRLASEQTGRGAVVARIGIGDLVALYEVREVLEGLVTRRAVERSGQLFIRHLAECHELHSKAVKAGDLEAHFQADAAFHSEIRNASKSFEAARILDQIQAQVRLAMKTTSVTAGPKLALEDHATILKAIRGGDPDEAERAARYHVERLRRALEQQVTDVPERRRSFDHAPRRRPSLQ